MYSESVLKEVTNMTNYDCLKRLKDKDEKV